MSARTTHPRHAKPSRKAPVRASRGSAAAASAVIVAALTAGVVTPALADAGIDSVDTKPSGTVSDDTPDFAGYTTELGAPVEVVIDDQLTEGTDSDAGTGAWSVSFASINDGDHHFEVFVDGLPIGSGDFTIDTPRANIVDVDYAPSAPVVGDDVVISVDADADAVRYAYVVDGAAPVDSADPWFTIESVTAGEHVVSVRAFNADDLSTGNYTVGFDVAEAPAVDETAPVVTITTKPDLEWTSSAATFEWSVEDDDADITSYWSMDGSEPQATDLTSWEFAGESSLEDGEHTFEVWAQDSTGNVSDPVSYTFTITTGDDTPVVVVPTIAFTSTPAASTTSTTAHFVVEATEGSTIEYILDLPEGAQSATPLPVNGNELTFTDLAVGHHHLMVGATLGDQFSGVLEYEWDVVAPAVVTPPAPAAPAAPANPVAPVILASDAIPAAQITNGISAGASGPSVAIIQRVVGTPADGRFGRLTSAAVRAFQRAHGLVADGVVGPLTWAAIVDVANGGAGVTPVTPTSVPRAVILRGVTHGAHGQAVATIQRVLGVSADGRFGPQTTAAVRAFQRAHGLVVDGIVGRLTWAAMTAS